MDFKILYISENMSELFNDFQCTLNVKSNILLLACSYATSVQTAQAQTLSDFSLSSQTINRTIPPKTKKTSIFKGKTLCLGLSSPKNP